MAAAVTWILFTYLSITSSQTLRQYQDTSLRNQGICRSKVCPNLAEFQAYYKDCIVVIGTLQLTLFEKTKSENFQNVTFPNLREITEFFVVYRVQGLLSLGKLFPNLARIRGEKLLNNYALIIHDMTSLKEIGLYGLVKIDRGGVLIWGVPQACYINTVDWRNIVPRSRLVISSEDRLANCKSRCGCSLDTAVNRCWNNIKCQIYLEGTEADNCHDQCLGCRKTRSDVCTLCRHYTYNGKCVSRCPSNTILLPNSQYCITSEECDHLDGWIWNNTCVFHCTLDYVEQNTATGIVCKHKPSYNKICQSLDIWAVGKAQEAEGCVFVNGSLEIHIRPVAEIMHELKFLNRIREVSDYVAIYSSMTITSLSFLSSLKRIKGRKLKEGRYSLIISDMANLQTLFTKKVTENLKIDNGTLKVYANPTLCKRQISMIQPLFPVQPNNETDMPTGLNGYSGGCEDGVSFQVRIVNETSVMVLFSTISDPGAHYSLLYVHLPPGTPKNLVPETCSDYKWYVENVETDFGHQYKVVELTSLRPASTYAICIETYDPVLKILARSNIVNFTTPVGKPEPPFIRMLVASTSSSVVVHWANHKDYHPFITHYQLDVSLLEIYERDISVKNQCKHLEYEYTESGEDKHAIVLKLPPEYEKTCDSICEIGKDHFDYFICNSITCDTPEYKVTKDSYFGKYIKTKVFNFTSNWNNITVDGLAPFRDYRFRLRACTEMECSRSTREVVRTLLSEVADLPTIIDIQADEYGNITVKWNPPDVTNGPILSYSVEVVPIIDQSSTNLLNPQIWCVLANTTSLKLKAIAAKTYFVRVCTRSMAFNRTCTEWEYVKHDPTWWWFGVAFAIFLFIASVKAGSMIKRMKVSIDLEPILESSVSVDESEPPCKMVSDFTPVYVIPLRDTDLE